MESSNSPSPRRPRGRPRSASVDEALAKAALEEFRANGFHRMSMDAIAERAGVSKVSLYRRWGSKLEVVGEVMRRMSDTAPPADHGDFVSDVRALLRASMGTPEARSAARMLMRTVGELADDPALLEVYRTHLFAPRMAQMRALVERAKARSELREGLSVEVASALIAGPIFVFMLAHLVDERSRVSPRAVDELAEAIRRAVVAEAPARRSASKR
ncbi:MAG: TetR/AcrR family transcriptional regulator [Sandaracinus sp.]